MADARIGSRSIGGRRRYGLGWVPWLALLMLALAALIIFLVVRNVADEDDRTGLDASNDRSTASPAPTPVPGAGAAGVGTFTAGGRPLIQEATAGRLAQLVGQPVDGRGVTVQSVVADEGFWAGASDAERVFVFLTPQARTRAGESPFQVQPGQRVDLAGTVKPVPADLTPFGADRSEGADQLRSQRHYVEAASVRLSA